MTTKPRILVAFGDKLMKRIIADTLESAGYAVLLAGDGEEALTRASSEHPDLLVVDILMPRLNGIHVARELKSNPATRRIPIIIVSSLSHTPAAQLTQAEAYVQKPFGPVELLTQVGNLLRRCSPASEPPGGVASAAAPHPSISRIVPQRMTMAAHRDAAGEDR